MNPEVYAAVKMTVDYMLEKSGLGESYRQNITAMVENAQSLLDCSTRLLTSPKLFNEGTVDAEGFVKILRMEIDTLSQLLHETSTLTAPYGLKTKHREFQRKCSAFKKRSQLCCDIYAMGLASQGNERLIELASFQEQLLDSMKDFIVKLQANLDETTGEIKRLLT